MTDETPRVLGQEPFCAELVAVTRERAASTYLYLMLEEGGTIGVQWEQPGIELPREHG